MAKFNPSQFRSQMRQIQSRLDSKLRQAKSKIQQAQRQFQAKMRELQREANHVTLHVDCSCGYAAAHRYHISMIPTSCPRCDAPIC